MPWHAIQEFIAPRRGATEGLISFHIRREFHRDAI
jgi:hypothetical protein